MRAQDSLYRSRATDALKNIVVVVVESSSSDIIYRCKGYIQLCVVSLAKPQTKKSINLRQNARGPV